MLKHTNLPSIRPVQAGAKATLEVPIGPTYYRVVFTAIDTGGVPALAASQFGRIDVNLDGNRVQTYKNLQRLVDLNAYYGREADTVSTSLVQFAIHFFRAEMNDVVYRRQPGIGTKDLSTFTIDIDLGAAFPATATLVAHAEFDPVPMPVGAFLNVGEFTASASVSGPYDVDKLKRGPWYQAIHLFKADVSHIELTANEGQGDTRLVYATKSVLERFQKAASPVARVPQTAKATHIDFALHGDLQDTVQSAAFSAWALRATLDTSGSMDVVTETLDALAR